jgi:putative hydrolase of the HAD superfamily
METKAVIFDFFGVICTNVAGNWFKKHLKRADADFIHETMHHADMGHESEEKTFTKLAQAANAKHDVRKLWLSDATINWELVDIVRELRKKYKVAICSNAPADFFHTVLRENNLEALFDVIVVSSEVGLVKPEKEIFEHICRELTVFPKEAIFIDDTKRNVEAAESLGMKGIVFSQNDQIRALL